MAEPAERTASTLIVGGAGGLGASMCERLARAGHRLAVVDASRERCEALRARLAAQDLDVTVRAGDASAPETYVDLLEEWASRGHPVTGLVHAAASASARRPFRAMRRDDWSRVVDDSLTSAFVSAQLAARWMAPAERGRIVFLSSILALHIGASSMEDAAYTAAKAGMHGLVRSLARALGRRNVTVNAVAPGFVRTELTAIENERGTDDAVIAAWARVCPMGRCCTADEVASVVEFLLSPAASFVNGAVIPVDGGYQC